MTLFSLFLKCLALGFSIAMVLGPISILCIQQTLANGMWAGMAVGLGAATADGIFAVVAGIGLYFINTMLLTHQFWLNLLGGLFLGYLGIRTLISKPPTTDITLKASNLLGLYCSTLFLTMTNPVTIISFSALLASVNISVAPLTTFCYALILFLGFFIGSIIWWILLTSTLTIFREKIKPSTLQRINTIAGVMLIIFGIGALIRAFL